MGGYGSGQWRTHTKRTVEEVQALRVRDIVEKVREAGKVMGSASLAIETSAGPQEVCIVDEPAPFGGTRFFLACPRCDTRRLALYFVRGVLACRVCHRLTYTSCQDSHKYDQVFAHLAAGMGPGVTPSDVKTALSKRPNGLRDVRLLDAADKASRDMTRVMGRMKKGKT